MALGNTRCPCVACRTIASACQQEMVVPTDRLICFKCNENCWEGCAGEETTRHLVDLEYSNNLSTRHTRSCTPTGGGIPKRVDQRAAMDFASSCGESAEVASDAGRWRCGVQGRVRAAPQWRRLVVRGWCAVGGRPGEGESGSPAWGAMVEPPRVRSRRTFFGRATAKGTGRD
jgi:hypothetical protein